MMRSRTLTFVKFFFSCAFVCVLKGGGIIVDIIESCSDCLKSALNEHNVKSDLIAATMSDFHLPIIRYLIIVDDAKGKEQSLRAKRLSDGQRSQRRV